MSDQNEEKIVHTYDDDLHEMDNRLPLWWQYTLYGAIVFAVADCAGEHQIGAWMSQRDHYEKDMIAARIEAAKKGGGMSADVLLAMSRKEETVREGKQVFQSTCSACHRADGGGNIGPNLTDEYWLHGGKPENIFACVHDGVAGKGMPTWGPQLGEEKVADVVAYVLTIRNTHVPGGKAPQGDQETP